MAVRTCDSLVGHGFEIIRPGLVVAISDKIATPLP